MNGDKYHECHEYPEDDNSHLMVKAGRLAYQLQGNMNGPEVFPPCIIIIILSQSSSPCHNHHHIVFIIITITLSFMITIIIIFTSINWDWYLKFSTGQYLTQSTDQSSVIDVGDPASVVALRGEVPQGRPRGFTCSAKKLKSFTWSGNSARSR